MKQLDLSGIEQKEIFIMAFRYALGRSTYVIADMVDMISRNWDNFRPDEKKQFKGDIELAIKHRRAGMDMDIKLWKTILELED